MPRARYELLLAIFTEILPIQGRSDTGEIVAIKLVAGHDAAEREKAALVTLKQDNPHCFHVIRLIDFLDEPDLGCKSLIVEVCRVLSLLRKFCACAPLYAKHVTSPSRNTGRCAHPCLDQRWLSCFSNRCKVYLMQRSQGGQSSIPAVLCCTSVASALLHTPMRTLCQEQKSVNSTQSSSRATILCKRVSHHKFLSSRIHTHDMDR